MRLPKRSWEKLKIWDDGPIYLTEDAILRLREKLAQLQHDLPAFIQEAARTADYGDRSDNAEYKEAKSILRRANRQILILGDQIKRAVAIKTGRNENGVVQLGSTVVLENDGGQKIYQILGPQETNPSQGKISCESPLGKLLMQRKVGETIELKTANGIRSYRILEVR